MFSKSRSYHVARGGLLLAFPAPPCSSSEIPGSPEPAVHLPWMVMAFPFTAMEQARMGRHGVRKKGKALILLISAFSLFSWNSALSGHQISQGSRHGRGRRFCNFVVNSFPCKAGVRGVSFRLLFHFGRFLFLSPPPRPAEPFMGVWVEWIFILAEGDTAPWTNHTLWGLSGHPWV